MWRLFDRLFVCTLRAAKAARALDLPTVEVNQASAQAQVESRNNSHELRDFIVLPSSVWASHRNELRQEQAACKQAALARAPGDDTKSVLGKRFRTTRRSRGGAARGGGTPSSTSKAPGSSARWRTFLCTITTQTRSGSAPVLSTATRVQRHAARMTHGTITSTPQTLQASAAACRSSMTERYALLPAA